MRGTVLGNGRMIGAGIVPISLLGIWMGVMWSHDVTDPIAWGLALFTFIFICLMQAVCAELADAIRSRQP